MKRNLVKFLSVFMFLSVFSLSFVGVGSAAFSVGYCDVTITKENLGYDNGAKPTNYCERVIGLLPKWWVLY